MSMTQRELIDYCNGRDGKCSDTCLHNSRECDAFVSKYRCVPCLSNIIQPELYSDDVIEVQDGEEYRMSMTLEELIRFHTEEAEKMKLHRKVNEIILGTETYEIKLQEHTQTAEWLKELKAVKDLIRQHDEDSMPEDFWYIDEIREVVQE